MKEQTKHTPGPWWVEGPFDGGEADLFIRCELKDNDGFDTENADIACLSHDETGDYEANARLIAAAPELLAELKALVAIFDPERQGIYNFARPFIQVAQEVIAKAEGGINENDN